MNIQGAEAFLAIVATKNISKAAEQLFLSQSTVSQQVKSLETELGVMLIERGKGQRSVELTFQGQKFISIAERFLQLTKEANNLRHDKSFLLSISCVDSLNTYTLAQFYKEFLQLHPTVNLQLNTYQSPEIYDRVENHIADIGIVNRQLRYPNVIINPLFHEKMYLIQRLQPGEKQEKKQIIQTEELDFSKEILLPWGEEHLRWRDKWCSPGVRARVEVNTLSTLMHFLAGEYWAVVPQSILRTFEHVYPLAVAELSEPPGDRVSYLVTHRHPRISHLPVMDLFREALARYIPGSSDLSQNET